MESLLFFVVIIAISALSNWLKRKQEEQQRSALPTESTADAPPPTEAAPGRKPWDWEAELRRLFDDRPPPAPPPPAEPPPVVFPPEPASAAAQRPFPADVPSPRPSAVPALEQRMEGAKERLHERLARLKRADAAYHRAQQLDQSVSARLDRLGQLRQDGRVESAEKPQRRQRTSPEVQRVRAALARPRSAREAIIAAEILSRPPGLQP
ncbi:MAG: hypothetical protein H7A45_03490 [Verrucomicrobiales bacterium]|nr:hypothetical protein [Verrucomicrobiales bacterium]MCP5527742.1 hypothetical protein [Verrucomicrobiales bacterium]